MPEEINLLEGFEIPDDFDIVEDEATVVSNDEDNEVITQENKENVIADPEPTNDDTKEQVDLVLGDNGEADNPGDDTELFNVLAESLKEQGLLSSVDDTKTITDLEKLTSAFKGEIKNNEYSDLNDTQKRVLDAFRNGVPEEDILKHEKAVVSLNNVTKESLEGDEELRKNIILSDLKSKGISDTRAEKLYIAMYDSGDDIDEAMDSLSALKQAEQAEYDKYTAGLQKDRDDRIKAKQKEFDKLKDNIDNIDKFLGEIPISDTIRENVQKAMSVPVDYTEQGVPINKLMKARIDDPIAFETNLYYLFELTNGFKDLKTFSKRATSKAAKDISKAIGNSTFVKSGSKPSFQADPDSYSGSGIVELIND